MGIKYSDIEVSLNIKKHFRIEFEKQRTVTDKEEHEKFREGMMKFCSNYLYYAIKKDYQENKEFYDTDGLYDRNTPHPGT